jgi:tRNA threonylcarbamoyladenosine biosynthesis protein TsaE
MSEEGKTKVICRNETDLISVAEQLFQKYPSHKFFALYGEMGAGKTTLIKVLCRLLKSTDVVSSPTFSIVNIYKTKQFGDIFHFDFYRMKSIEEAFDIGYEDYFYGNAYCFAEWPEKIESLLPAECIKVNLEVNPDGSREISF